MKNSLELSTWCPGKAHSLPPPNLTTTPIQSKCDDLRATHLIDILGKIHSSWTYTVNFIWNSKEIIQLGIFLLYLWREQRDRNLPIKLSVLSKALGDRKWWQITIFD